MKTNRPGRAVFITAFAGLGLAVALGGCGSIGNALGFSKRPPDEFEVLAKAPLVVPPDYNLRPPAEEELALKDRNPREMAFRALFPPQPKREMPALPPEDVGISPLDQPPQNDLFSNEPAGDDPFN